jgi:hypothetical protein
VVEQENAWSSTRACELKEACDFLPWTYLDHEGIANRIEFRCARSHRPV